MAGDKVEALLVALLEGGAAQGLQQFLAMWRERLLRSEFRAGCPVLAAAVEEPVESTASQPRAAAAEVFARWHGHLASAFVAEGHAPAAAGELASLVIASVEGRWRCAARCRTSARSTRWPRSC